MPNSLSLLLGAGFSAPMGYPIGNKVNDLLLKCKDDNFTFHTSGHLTVNQDGSKPDFGYKTSHQHTFEFCADLIQYYKDKFGRFDYEEFYDYIVDGALKDADVVRIAEPYLGQPTSVEQLIYRVKPIYNQVVAHYIKDRDGKTWYDDEPYTLKPRFPGYTGFLNSLIAFSEDSTSVNIHTLNHDLFFERLNMTEWFEAKITDGFEENGSPFYGTLSVNSRKYNCRLQQYTGNYEGKFKLYKLHGSFDYGAFYKASPSGPLVPDVYIKTRYGIGFDELLKETADQHGKAHYETCFVNYHADFLTGTTSKIERYKEPLLFQKLFELFRQNLQNADSLVIIGYGCKDSEINKMIVNNFNYKKHPTRIVDPYPSAAVRAFAESVGATIITTFLEELKITDLN